MKKLSSLQFGLLFVMHFYLSPLSAQKAIWDALPIGKYGAGFYTTVVFDYAQNYPYCLDSSLKIKKYPKPLIVNVWYPATIKKSSKKMLLNEYLDFHSNDKNIKNWLQRYQKYTEGVRTKELMGKTESLFDAQDMQTWKSFQELSSTAEKKAKSAYGKFPLIIYHQGAEASCDDNAILCEWLASQGYVVIGSSFQQADGEKLSTHGLDNSVKDASFLLNYARSLPHVDWSHSAIIGHSLGAQTVNYMAVQHNMAFDAMVSLETTQEYYIGTHNMWPYVTHVNENISKAKTKLLFASNPHAIHDLADKMVNSERYYLTIPDIGHNDFISQGIQKRYLLYEKNKSFKEDFLTALHKYSTLCTYLLAFLDAKLKEDKKWNDKFLFDNSLMLGQTAYLEYMPVGKRDDHYLENGYSTPTPRQLKFLILEKKLDSVTYLINKFWKKDSKDPIYDPTFIYAMTYHLLEKDTASAVKLYIGYKKIIDRTRLNKQFYYFGRLYARFGLKEYAKNAFEKLILLDPENLEEVNKVKSEYLK